MRDIDPVLESSIGFCETLTAGTNPATDGASVAGGLMYTSRGALVAIMIHDDTLKASSGAARNTRKDS